MTGHLPDCDDYAFSGAGFHPNCDRICICRQVRRIEQRVRLENDDYAYVAAQAEADGRRRGWNEALDAAREAVERVSTLFEPLGPALAAIDALSENPDDLPVLENPNDAR